MKKPWELPAGWKRQEMLDGSIVLTNLDKGHVTVNLARRGFELGYGTKVPYLRETNIYQGHGWRDLLFNDAIAALSEVYK